MSLSTMSAIVEVPLPLQLLSLSVALQFTAIVAVLWRGFFGMPQLSTRRPRWPFIPLLVGCALGVWYAVIQRDLVFGAAQGLALFIGFCLINSTRGVGSGDMNRAPRLSRSEKRAAKRGRRSGGE